MWPQERELRTDLDADCVSRCLLLQDTSHPYGGCRGKILVSLSLAGPVQKLQPRKQLEPESSPGPEWEGITLR